MKKSDQTILIGVGLVAAYFLYKQMQTANAAALPPGSPATAQEQAQSAASTLQANLDATLGV